MVARRTAARAPGERARRSDPDLGGRERRQGPARLTSEGENQLVGFTALAPRLPPAAPIPPTERVLGADTVATAAPVADLSADGGSVAFITQATPTDCDHVAVWTPGAQSVTRYDLRAPCGFGETHVYGVELAGSASPGRRSPTARRR